MLRGGARRIGKTAEERLFVPWRVLRFCPSFLHCREYAKQQSRQFAQPWRSCPNCKQYYQNELAVELASEFVAFVEGKYPGDLLKHITALDRKLSALISVADCLEPKQREEAKQIANKILSMIEQMKKEHPFLAKRALKMEAVAYGSLGEIAHMEGTKEGARTAVGYFEKCRDINNSIDDSNGVLAAESNIALAKSEYEGSKANDEEQLEKSRALYELNVEQYGQEDACTIRNGIDLAIDLSNAKIVGCIPDAKRMIEGERLLTKLAAISKRVHGPDHNVTKDAESTLQKLRILYLSCAVIIVSTLYTITQEGWGELPTVFLYCIGGGLIGGAYKKYFA